MFKKSNHKTLTCPYVFFCFFLIVACCLICLKRQKPTDYESVRRRLAAEQQHFQESTAGFSSLSENLRGGACHARWQWCSLDAHITTV